MRQFRKYVVWGVTTLMLVLIYIGAAIIDGSMFIISYLPVLILFGILTWRVISNKKNGLRFVFYSHIAIVVPVIIILFFLPTTGVLRNSIKSIANTMYAIDLSTQLHEVAHYLQYNIIPFLLVVSAVSWYLFKFTNRQDQTSAFLLAITAILCMHTLLFFLPYRTALKDYLKIEKKRVQMVNKDKYTKRIHEITTIMSYMDTVSPVTKELRDSLEHKFNELPSYYAYRSVEISLPNQIINDLRNLEKLYEEKNKLTTKLAYKKEELELLRTIYFDLRPLRKCNHFKHRKHKRKAIQ